MSRILRDRYDSKVARQRFVVFFCFPGVLLVIRFVSKLYVFSGFIASGKSGKIISLVRQVWKVRESQGLSGKKVFLLYLVRESQGIFLLRFITVFNEFFL